MNSQEAVFQARLDDIYWKRERAEAGSEDYRDLDLEIQYLNEEINQIRKTYCDSHMTRIYSHGGYDRCANCGAKD